MVETINLLWLVDIKIKVTDLFTFSDIIPIV